jgi:hypothetical protein
MEAAPMMSFGILLIAGVVALILVVGLVIVVAAVASSGKRERDDK